jgi:hypothetical protein
MNIVGQNIFIDFDIIKESNSEKLREELDTLIMLKNRVYVWSKTIPPAQMRQYCKSIKFNFEEEKELHTKVKKLRREKKTYKEIEETTKVPVNKIGFYLATDPNKTWTLDDWILEYHQKDSMIYSKVDFVIDSNARFVDRFQMRGADGNVIERID